MTKRDLINALENIPADDDELIWLDHPWPEAMSTADGVYVVEDMDGTYVGSDSKVTRLVIR